MHEQEQFLQVLDRDEAERRFRAALDLTPRGVERVALSQALGRVLAADVVSPVDVPSFDRSNVDGFAVVAEDTFGAAEEAPHRLRLSEEAIHTGVVPVTTVHSRPRGRDRHRRDGAARSGCRRHDRTRQHSRWRGVRRAGRCGRQRHCLRGHRHHRGRDRTAVWRVADEPRYRSAGGHRRGRGRRLAQAGGGNPVHGRRDHPAGQPMQPARVYDSNAQVLADAVRELGCEPLPLGIIADDVDALRAALQNALGRADVVLLSAARARARETSRTGSSPNSSTRASSRTASRSSPASRYAWP